MITLLKITEKNFGLYQNDILEIEKASFPSPWDVGGFREEINNPGSHLWVLLEDTVAGYLCFLAFTDKIHLMNIAVHPEKRRKGLGGYLLNRMIEEGASLGGKSAFLEVRSSNLAAKSFYKKAHFRESGRLSRYYKDTNEDAIIMSLSLGGEKIFQIPGKNPCCNQLNYQDFQIQSNKNGFIRYYNNNSRTSLRR